MPIIIWVLLMFYLPFSVQASELSGSIEKGILTWTSAKTGNYGLKPYYWGVASQLPAANAITLGGIDSSRSTSLVLSGHGGQVTVPIALKGMVYQLSDYSKQVDNHTGSSTNVAGRVVQVMGDRIGQSTFTLSSLSSPITHYQPIIDNTDFSGWVQEFELAKVGKGVYLGSLPYSFSYLYIRDGITMKHTVSARLAVRVNYDPAAITNVSHTGSGVITPIYYGYPERKVKGSTDYRINISGYFPWGIQMGLKRNHYQLRSASYSAQKKENAIDYSVICKSGCQGGLSRIVKDGVAMINDSTTRLKIQNATNMNASIVIEVSFDDKNVSELEGGVYTGSFVLTFEAEL